MGAEDCIWGAGESHQPVSAHEGDELSERSHNTQQSPQHGAAGDNDMAHADGGWGLLTFQHCREVKRWKVVGRRPSQDRELRLRSFFGGDVRASEHFTGRSR